MANVETLKLGIDGLEQVERIGAGGSARVYKAKQSALDRWIALKVINAGGNPEVARRFDRERKAMGRLSHNVGIVPVYSTGMTAQGEPYLIMPYYPEGSLQDQLEHGAMPWAEAVDMIIATAKTIAAAHDAGVVHLDLKPANILLTSDGAPRVSDFGIAKLTTEKVKTTAGSAFTPAYSAPETLLDGEASPAADVYGLTATLWALIAGRAPFRSRPGDAGMMAVVNRVINDAPEPLADDVPTPIRQIVDRGLSKNPADRFATAGELADALVAARTSAQNTTALTGADAQFSDAPANPAAILSSASSPAPPTAAPARTMVRVSALAYDTSDIKDLWARSPVAALAGVSGATLVLVVLGVWMLQGLSGSNNGATESIAGPQTVTTAASSGPLTTSGAEVGNDRTTSTLPEQLGAQASLRSTLAPSSTTTTESHDTTSSTEDGPSTSSEPTTSTTVTSITAPITTSTSIPTTTTTTTTTTVPTAPEKPTSVTVVHDDNDPTLVLVEWDEPANGTEPTGYVVWRDGSPITNTPLDPNVRSYRDDPGAGSYSYQLQAVNQYGASPLSASIMVEVPSSATTTTSDSA